MASTSPATTTTQYLSKTDYLHGLQCLKLFWHTRNAKQLVPPPDQQTLAVFDEGKRVGQLAWQLFPGGIEIRGNDFDDAVAMTEQALQRRCPMYEPAFVFNGCCVRADILVPAGDDGWDLIEVKSTTRVEEIHLHDLAFQVYVLGGAGLKIRRCILAHINSSFVKHGPIDSRRFFVLEDVTDQVSALSRNIEDNVDEMFRTIRLPQAPTIQIGRHCDHPHRCPLQSACWGYLPDGNVTELYRGGARRFQLLAHGITAIADIPHESKLTTNQRIQRQVVITGEPHVNKPAIRAFLQQLKFSLSFLDFESYAPAIPLHDGTRPYEQICFQFSLHILRSQDTEAEHFGFLAEGTDDPRFEFMRRLQEVLPPDGSVIAFNSSFESSRLDECAKLMPEFQPWVDGIKCRMIDLLVPFRQFAIYHPQQHGSCSMKQVLPAMCGKTYDDLTIQNGTVASLQFLRATFGNISDQERTRIRNELQEYCHLDTFGLVAITETLRKLVSDQIC